MNYNVVIKESAQRDVEKITDYLVNILYSKQAANNFLDALSKKIKILSKNPYIYAAEQVGRRLYRKTMVNQYVVAFRIDEETKTVYIIAIGHSRMQKSRLLKKR